MNTDEKTTLINTLVLVLPHVGRAEITRVIEEQEAQLQNKSPEEFNEYIMGLVKQFSPKR